MREVEVLNVSDIKQNCSNKIKEMFVIKIPALLTIRTYYGSIYRDKKTQATGILFYEKKDMITCLLV